MRVYVCVTCVSRLDVARYTCQAIYTSHDMFIFIKSCLYVYRYIY